uniref:TPS6 n=1 Tax=Arundo donax TaxID=35708 RepID=A0A0A9AXF1_ARUDO
MQHMLVRRIQCFPVKLEGIRSMFLAHNLHHAILFPCCKPELSASSVSNMKTYEVISDADIAAK